MALRAAMPNTMVAWLAKGNRPSVLATCRAFVPTHTGREVSLWLRTIRPVEALGEATRLVAAAGRPVPVARPQPPSRSRHFSPWGLVAYAVAIIAGVLADRAFRSFCNPRLLLIGGVKHYQGQAARSRRLC